MPSIHDPVFQLPPRPPHRWGSSPFHTRGVIYRDEWALSDRVLAPMGTSVVDLVRKTGDAALEKFVAQKFDTSGWYDIQPAVWVGAMVARARGVPFATHTRDASMEHAASAVRGFSAVLLKLVSNETVASWVPRISTWFHDFGAVESKVDGPCHVRGFRTGVPVFMVHAWSIAATSFVERVLVHIGAKEPRAHALSAEPDGVLDGVPLYRIGFDVHWNG